MSFRRIASAVLILTQWEAAVNQYKAKHQEYDSLTGGWVWNLANDDTLSAQHR